METLNTNFFTKPRVRKIAREPNARWLWFGGWRELRANVNRWPSASSAEEPLLETSRFRLENTSTVCLSASTRARLPLSTALAFKLIYAITTSSQWPQSGSKEFRFRCNRRGLRGASWRAADELRLAWPDWQPSGRERERNAEFAASRPLEHRLYRSPAAAYCFRGAESKTELVLAGGGEPCD